MSVLLEVKGLSKHFQNKRGLFRPSKASIKAVNDVSFQLIAGRSMGLVGESGCGKSTLGRMIVRLDDATQGRVILDGTDITDLNYQQLFEHRRKIQIIFQDPNGSLSPRRTVYQSLLEPLETHNIGSKLSRHKKIEDTLALVGISKCAVHSYPHEFSGGQKQRICIARALMLDPKCIVADEVVSALDVSVQSQILALFLRLQKDLGVSFLFISHDLAVVQHVCQDIGVMYLGRLVEQACVSDLFNNPRHPYTQALLSAMPVPDPGSKKNRQLLKGDLPSPFNPPSGCAFRTRCPHAMARCADYSPPPIKLNDGNGTHWAACHLLTSNQ